MLTWAMIKLFEMSGDMSGMYFLLSMIFDTSIFFFVAVCFKGWPK